MPQVIQPYLNPDTLEHHAVRHSAGGLDELTPEMIGISNLDVLPIELGGTGCTDNNAVVTWLGGILTYADVGACADDDLKLSDSRTPLAHVVSHKSGGSDAITPADIGACGNTDLRLSDARIPLGHAASHKAGGSDEITAADIGACVISDSRLTDARTPVSHATTHETGSTDELTPEGIGAAPVGHTHAAYLAASFDSATGYLTIGTKTYDLSTLEVV